MANMHLVTGYAGQEHITAADQGAWNAAIVGSGEYVLRKGSQFAATVITNNQIRIADGDILMQGRHIRLNEGTYVDLAIENGAQGYFRNDLIVARYTKNSSTGVEEANLVVIKGTASASAASDPAHTTGDIINDHVLQNDMPLYRVPLDGLTVGDLVPLFTVLNSTVADRGAQSADKITETFGSASGGTASSSAATTMWIMEGVRIDNVVQLRISLSVNVTSPNTFINQAFSHLDRINVPTPFIKDQDLYFPVLNVNTGECFKGYVKLGSDGSFTFCSGNDGYTNTGNYNLIAVATYLTAE